MSDKNTPHMFRFLLANMCIDKSDIIKTSDGFFMVNKSIANILSSKGIFDFLDSSGERLASNKFFDDWFLYAVSNGNEHIYGLLKLREQEHDAEYGDLADGDMPGVTISFISFNTESLMACLNDSTDENRTRLNTEINRVVSRRGQHHDDTLKMYFKNPQSQGAYLVADIYVKTIASYADNEKIKVPDYYKEIVKQSVLNKKSLKATRLPRFMEELNQEAGRIVCDNENIYIENREELKDYEFKAILATHTGNTSVYSFAAEVEYHARFLTPFAKIKIPFLSKSVYDSAIRADMTVGDTEFQGPAPFYRDNSKIVKRQRMFHQD